MSTNPQSVSLPVVVAADYRQAVPGESWTLSPASIAGPISYRSEPRNTTPASIAKLAAAALATPVDFPSIDAAILDGDHVALAVDPNVPQVGDVIEGVIETLAGCQAGKISVIVWPETPDTVLADLKQRFQNFDPDAIVSGGGSGSDLQDAAPVSPIITVARHAPQMRSMMRYVAADADADAMYLARDLVDADFVIPVIAARAADAVARLDKTGIFPMFADASTMRRYQGGVLPTFPSEQARADEHDADENQPDEDDTDTTEPPPRPSFTASDAAVNEVGFLLGVQLIMVVSSDDAGLVGRILAGTPDSIRHELETLHAVVETETRPKANLVIAALDGDVTAQTWPNVARAAIAAANHIDGAGMIVVWSRVNTIADEVWLSELGSTDRDAHAWEPEQRSSDDFDDWHTDRVLARQLATLVSDHRILLHSELATADVEALGLGVIGSSDELSKLAESFPSAGIVRAAQFHAASVIRLTLFDDED